MKKLLQTLFTVLVVAVLCSTLLENSLASPPPTGNSGGGRPGGNHGSGNGGAIGPINESPNSSGPNNNGGEYIGDNGSSGTGNSQGFSVSQPSVTGLVDQTREVLATGGVNPEVKVQNVSSVSLLELQQMVQVAAEAGGSAILCADNIQDGVVDVRLRIDPLQSTTDINLVASTGSQAVQETLQRLEKHYENKLVVIRFEQTGSFGQLVQVAAKLDLTGFDLSNLVFYVYNYKNNTIQHIQNPEYEVDQNGYLHFITEMGGDIVVSNGALVGR